MGVSSMGIGLLSECWAVFQPPLALRTYFGVGTDAKEANMVFENKTSPEALEKH